MFGCVDSCDGFRHYLTCPVLWQLAKEALNLYETSFEVGHRLCFAEVSVNRLRLLGFCHYLFHHIRKSPECFHADGNVRDSPCTSVLGLYPPVYLKCSVLGHFAMCVRWSCVLRSLPLKSAGRHWCVCQDPFRIEPGKYFYTCSLSIKPLYQFPGSRTARNGISAVDGVLRGVVFSKSNDYDRHYAPLCGSFWVPRRSFLCDMVDWFRHETVILLE